MELFTFVVSLVVMIMASEYQLYWIMIIVAGVMWFSEKSVKTFIIVSVIALLIYLVDGMGNVQYKFYVAAGGFVLYLLLNKGSGSDQGSYNPNDQYADLLKGLGG